MLNQDLYRRRFADDALATASPARIVIMAFDRLECDLTGALDALGNGEHETAHRLLTHAQDLVTELHLMLDVDRWEHAPGLAAIYEFIAQLLLRANIAKQSQPVAEARRLLAELGGAFRVAAVENPSATGGGRTGGGVLGDGADQRARSTADGGAAESSTQRPSGFSLRV